MSRFLRLQHDSRGRVVRRPGGRCFPIVERLEDRCVPSGTPNPAVQAFGQLPLSFEANQGQTDPRVNFLTRGPGYALFLTPGQAVLRLQQPSPATVQSQVADLARHAPPPNTNPTTVLTMQLVGANLAAPSTGLDPLPGKSNYFLGNDPSQWHTDVANYGQVEYQNVYPGINLVYYGNQQQLEYDFRVAPGANPGAIQLDFQGAQALSLDAQGNLVIHTAGGDVVENAPVLYQDVGGVRQPVAGQYVLLGNNQAGFQVGAYDVGRELVIDPVLSYSTYLGGSGEDDINGLGIDGSGNVYVGGFTSSTDFPLQNPFQSSNGPQSDAFIAKLNSTGTALVYSTYLGGSTGQVAFALTVDASGEAIVTGNTLSSDWPLKNPFQPSPGDSDNGFLTKLSAAGNSLVFSTYLGGNNFDAGDALAVDSNGNIYVGGVTASTNFPTRSPVQPTEKGTTNAFISEFTPDGSALVYSTYLGGSGDDEVIGIAADSTGNTYVAGLADDTNFPTTSGAFQPNNKNGINNKTNGFIAKLAPNGASLVYSTYLGGSDDSVAQGITADNAGNAYVTGYTHAADFPTKNAFQSQNKAASGGGRNAFVTKLNPTGTALVYSTLLGGSTDDNSSSIALDTAGDAYVTGGTKDSDFPTLNAVQGTYGGPSSGAQLGDAFITELAPTGSSLVYSTYLGGSGDDKGSGIAVDRGGNAYVGGIADSSNFPTTSGAFQGSGSGGSHSFIARITGNLTTLTLTPPTTATAGVPTAIIVSVLDPTGNVKSDYSGTVHFTSSDGRTVLSSDYTFTSADRGVHTFPITLLTAGNQSITVTDTANGGPAPITGSIPVLPGPLQSFGLVGLPSTLTAGNIYTVTVSATDAFGNPAKGYRGTITFRSSDSSARLPLPYTFTASDAGSKTFLSAISFTKAGTPNLTITDDSTPPLSLTMPLVVAPATLAQLQVSAPATSLAEAPFAVTVTALDAFGNLEVAYQGTVGLSSSVTGTGAVLPSAYTFTTGGPSADNGQHTFPGIALVAGTQSLTVSDPLGGISGGANVTVSNPVPTLAAIGPVSGQVLGPPIPLTITGGNFVHVSTIQVNGKALPTTFVSSTQLTTTLPQTNLAVSATLSVAVTTPGPGGGTTGPLPFAVADAPLAVAGAPLAQLLPAGPNHLTVATFTYGRAEPSSSFAASIDWGDRTITGGTITLAGSTYSITGDHSYSVPGDYTVNVHITDRFGGSASGTTQALVGDTDQRALGAVYQDILHRPIDGNGLPYWTFQLHAGMSLARISAAIAHSDEHFGSVIQADYQAALGRAPDLGGLQYWIGRMHAGLTDEQFYAQLLASPEFLARSGGSNDSFVQAVYPLLLGRKAEPDGEGYWLLQLDQGASRAAVALGLATTLEARSVGIEADYRQLLGRTAQPQEVNFWVNAMARGGTDEDVLGALAGSNEYFLLHSGT